MPHIDVQWADLPGGVHADTDGHSHIRIHRRLLQVGAQMDYPWLILTRTGEWHKVIGAES